MEEIPGNLSPGIRYANRHSRKSNLHYLAVNSNRLYAIVESKNGGVFRSDDAGKTWAVVSTKNDLTQRPWYFSGIYADPKNENTVYILNVNVAID